MDIRADEITVHLKLKGGKEIQLEYREATINESLDFLETIEKKDFSLIEYVYNFLVEYGDKKMTKKEFQENVILEFKEILEIIKKTRFSGFFETPEGETSENTEKLENEPESNLKETKKQIGKTVSYVWPKMSKDPRAIMETYSWREVVYWAEWYIYHENEKTEEGRKANKTHETKQHIEENRDYYEGEFSKIDLYLKKQKEWKKN